MNAEAAQQDAADSDYDFLVGAGALPILCGRLGVHG
jgi:hypothetical protein